MKIAELHMFPVKYVGFKFLFLENKSCVPPAGYLAVSFPSFRSNFMRCMFPVIRNSISAFPGHTFRLLRGTSQFGPKILKRTNDLDRFPQSDI